MANATKVINPETLALLMQELQAMESGNPSDFGPGAQMPAPQPDLRQSQQPTQPAPAELFGAQQVQQQGDPGMAQIMELLKGMEQAPPTRQKPKPWQQALGSIGDAITNYGNMRVGGQAKMGQFALGQERKRQEFEARSAEYEKNKRDRGNEILKFTADRMIKVSDENRKRELSLDDEARRREEDMADWRTKESEKDTQKQRDKGISRVKSSRVLAVQLSDPELVDPADPDREQIQHAIRNQYKTGSGKWAYNDEGFLINIPGDPELQPVVPPRGGATKPASAQGSGPAPRGGSEYALGPKGAPIRKPAPMNLQGVKQQLENATSALDAMQHSYESSRKSGLAKQTMGAIAERATTTEGILGTPFRGIAQRVIPTAKAATIHERHRGTAAALMARPLSGTARAQWISKLLLEVMPHFTDDPEVAGGFYEQVRGFIETAKTLPWGANPLAAQKRYEQEISNFLSGLAESKGIEVPPPPDASADELYDAFQRSRQQGGQ